MYVCVCKAVSDRQIRQAIREGATQFRVLQRELGVCTGCGKCAPQVHSLLRETQSVSDDTYDLPLAPMTIA
ncbi:MAG: (2Fe-2S)-binding protein [Candidatus Competibacteraceae bacterium]|jgi:bacterioferritin-associated ferredoxin|nr:(2Fe-2S)-binding protein [Candidatus Competibacteraceae bacterium]